MLSLQNGWHPHKFKRANKALRRLKTYLGRTIRDIARQIAGQEELEVIFRWPLYQASAVLEHRQSQRGGKIWSLHAPEVECISKGKAHAPYEFGVKAREEGRIDSRFSASPARASSFCATTLELERWPARPAREGTAGQSL